MGVTAPKKAARILMRRFAPVASLSFGPGSGEETKSLGPGAGPCTAISSYKHPPVRANCDQGETQGNKERF